MIPRAKYKKVTLSFLYLKAVGRNSYMDISIIMPAVRDKIKLRIVDVIIFFKNIKANMAPKVSEKPDIKVYLKACILLFVA